MEQSVPDARAAAEGLGSPIYGLAGPAAERGILSMWASTGSQNRLVRLRFGSNDRYVDVTTATGPLGGTERLVREVIYEATRGAHLPFSLTVEERLVMVPVMDVQTQFRVVQTSIGHWSAAGGFKKRHLRLDGTPGTAPENLALTPVVLP